MNKVYDIETLFNLNTFIFKDIDTKEVDTFVIHKSNNQLLPLVEYLETVNSLIGFNNVRFDGQVIQFILDNHSDWLDLDGDEVANLIYRFAQEAIRSEFPPYREYQIKIKQVDLFLIHHFDNKAKRTSLKDVEVSLGVENVMDMPIHHTEKVYEDEIPMVLEYNLNDVESTYELYLKSIDLIKLRETLSDIYKLNLTNANDPKIGAEIFLDLLSKDMKIEKSILREMRTERKWIDLKSVILPYIKFKNKAFIDVLNNFHRNSIVYTLKDSLSYEMSLEGVDYSYGLGGIHGCIKPGIYTSDEKYTIIDIDVSSFYPNLAIVNNFRPKHLGDSFSRIYKSIYDQRKVIPKKDPRNGAYKLMLNGCFGKSNSPYSFFYDPLFMAAITLNGQLLISMLIDWLIELEDIQILQANTDGITLRVNKELEPKVMELCKNWEEMTQLTLEYAYYDKMVIRDVNNYLSIKTDGSVKCKGCFEVEKELHKNNSMKIVRKALSEYYVNNIPVETTIYNHTDILDFCKRSKMTKGNKLTSRYIKDGKYEEVVLSKTTRYYISNKGSVLMKVLPPLDKKKIDTLKQFSNQMNIFDIIDDIDIVSPANRETNIEAGYLCTVYNTHKENSIDTYNINYNYYIMECNKIINTING